MRTAAIALAALQLVKVGHFAQPVYATATPADPGAMYVVEQAGRIRRLARGRVTTFLDLRQVVQSGGEQGLLSMAFDPDYAHTRFFYVAYTSRDGDDVVARYPGGTTLFAVHDVSPNHNGGQLQFGPDGDLYWSNGDGGGEGDPFNLGQDLARPFARIMKLNVHRAGAKWQLVAFGLRNPWRFSFDALAACSSATWGRTSTRRSTTCRPGIAASRTSAGRTGRATTSFARACRSRHAGRTSARSRSTRTISAAPSSAATCGAAATTSATNAAARCSASAS
jgi:hypothetical protein